MDLDTAGLEPTLVDGSDGLDAPPIERARPHGGRIGTRMAVSLPGAVAGALLVTAIAFGAAARLASSSAGSDGAPNAATTGGDTATGGADGSTGGADGQLGEGPATSNDGEHGATVGKDPTSEPDGLPAAGHGTDGTSGAGTDANPGNGPAGDAAPPPPPTEPATIAIAVHLGDGRVTVEWGACDVDGFAAWKVVRSMDGHPTWPLGDGDKVVAASEHAGLRSVANADLSAGKTLWYRVYGLVRRDGELVVGCVSRIAGIRIPALTVEPTPKPDPTPKPTPDAIGTLGLTLALGEGKPFADWTACDGDWDLYKVVRSTNSTVTWPKGDGDTLVDVVGKDGATAFRDGNAPSGAKLWYRVFCVRTTDTGSVLVAASAARSIEVPAARPQPEPDPIAIDLSIALTDGGVALHWGACSDPSFVAYKVLRSAGSDPSSLPPTDGTQTIAVRESPTATSFTDAAVESGQAWTYRVQCIGFMNGHAILLGETAAKAVTLP